MGRTGVRIRELERNADSNFNTHKQAINSLSESVCSMSESNKIKTAILQELTERLIIAENLLQPVLNDITILRQSNFDYHFSLLCKSLDEARETIARINVRLDELENTAWRKFCRWVRLLFTV